MLTFLFWNLNRKPIQQKVVNICINFDIDVMMLIESTIDDSVLLYKLNTAGDNGYYFSDGIGCKDIKIFSRFSGDYLQPFFESERLTIRKVNLPGCTEFLLAVNHFPSRLHWSGESQAFESTRLSSQIKRAEKDAGHKRTVLVGDLNMNPFHDGLVSANGLHGVMSSKIARRIARTVQGEDYPFFYNPMWNFFGDRTPGPPGTYYYNNAEHKVFFWNIFDQVLIRPELLDNFIADELRILESDGAHSLLSETGLPKGSDHLPILFKLDI
ncbi:MAG TPA: endonuclease/exonuclease/phosphatase family protein [Syntrophorhabdaceae bacterium]|jgi:hypothetical protein